MKKNILVALLVATLSISVFGQNEAPKGSDNGAVYQYNQDGKLTATYGVGLLKSTQGGNYDLVYSKKSDGLWHLTNQRNMKGFYAGAVGLGSKDGFGGGVVIGFRCGGLFTDGAKTEQLRKSGALRQDQKVKHSAPSLRFELEAIIGRAMSLHNPNSGYTLNYNANQFMLNAYLDFARLGGHRTSESASTTFKMVLKPYIYGSAGFVNFKNPEKLGDGVYKFVSNCARVGGGAGVALEFAPNWELDARVFAGTYSPTAAFKLDRSDYCGLVSIKKNF